LTPRSLAAALSKSRAAVFIAQYVHGAAMGDKTAVVVPAITVFKANQDSKKGEDAAAIVNPNENAPAAFAIFDGHSGKQSSAICADTVCQRLHAAGPPFTPQAITDMFWAVDEEIGKQKIRDGATAQVLFVEPAEDGGFKCTLAWCGDSSAVVCDPEAPAGEVFYATESHTAGPDHQEGGRWQKEKILLEFFAKVRKAVEATGIDTLAEEVGVEKVGAAVDAVGEAIPEGYTRETMVTLMVRALRRGKIVAETFPDGKDSRKQCFVRQRDKDHDVNQVWVVATAEQRSDPGYSDLQMTRSMVDWRASDMVLPNPQIHTFHVPKDKIFRVVLASDGLWDICTFSQAAKHLKTLPTVQKAAEKMLKMAKDEYLGNRGHDMMDDDTTIICLELNPSGLPYPYASSGACCSLQ
jgi:serine/threonine protein phosphatase PrpC